jgi:hypothetical protein
MAGAPDGSCAPFLFLAQRSMTPSETLKVCTWGLAPSQALPNKPPSLPHAAHPGPSWGHEPPFSPLSKPNTESRSRPPSTGLRLAATIGAIPCFPSAFCIRFALQPAFSFPYRKRNSFSWLFLGSVPVSWLHLDLSLCFHPTKLETRGSACLTRSLNV